MHQRSKTSVRNVVDYNKESNEDIYAADMSVRYIGTGPAFSMMRDDIDTVVQTILSHKLITNFNSLSISTGCDLINKH